MHVWDIAQPAYRLDCGDFAQSSYQLCVGDFAQPINKTYGTFRSTVNCDQTAFRKCGRFAQSSSQDSVGDIVQPSFSFFLLSELFVKAKKLEP